MKRSKGERRNEGKRRGQEEEKVREERNGSGSAVLTDEA